MTADFALRVFLPFAFGYYLSYVFRTINSVIAPDLVADVGIDAAGLGVLSGIYFLTFAAFQLPLGVLLDRIGPRKSEAALLVIAAAGAALFAAAQSVSSLIVARGLVGLGVSACLMASFKAFVIFYPKDKLPLANGLVLMAGGLGAMSATVPVEVALQVTDWRGVFYGLGALSFLAAILVFTIVPERPKDMDAGPQQSWTDLAKGFGLVLKDPFFQRYVPLTLASQGTFLAIQTLWVGPWLGDVGGLDRSAVAGHLFIIAAAMTAGYLSMGAVAARLVKRGINSEHVALTGMVLVLVIQVLVITDNMPGVLLTWALFAFLGTSGSVMFAALSQHFPAHLTGRVSTMLNLLVFVAAFSMQWAIGGIINQWPVAADGAYHPDGYRAGFAVMLGAQVAGIAWLILHKMMVRGLLPKP